VPVARKRTPLSVPVFESDEEEFEFWETHDPEDYLTGETVSLDSILGPEDESDKSHASLEYPTTEIGGLESLFTPEGIEFVNAARVAKPSCPAKRKRTRF